MANENLVETLFAVINKSDEKLTVQELVLVMSQVNIMGFLTYLNNQNPSLTSNQTQGTQNLLANLMSMLGGGQQGAPNLASLLNMVNMMGKSMQGANPQNTSSEKQKSEKVPVEEVRNNAKNEAPIKHEVSIKHEIPTKHEVTPTHKKLVW